MERSFSADDSSTRKVRLLAFAAVRDVIGAPEAELDIGASTTAEELWPILVGRFPALEPHRRSIRLAVNGTYAFPNDPIAPGDEVALLPPVTGG